MVVLYFESILLGNSTSGSEEEQSEKEIDPSERENRIKNALENHCIFKKAEEEGGRFLSYLLSQTSQSKQSSDGDSAIFEEEAVFICKDAGIILGCLLLSGNIAFSDEYEKVLVPIYKEALLIGRRLLGNNNMERVGVMLWIYYLLVLLINC